MTQRREFPPDRVVRLLIPDTILRLPLAEIENPAAFTAMNTPLTRRTFLKTTTAASALAFPAVLRAQQPGTPSPNNRLNVAIIGAGGRGGAAVTGMKDENVVAICDVDQERADGSLKSIAQKFPAEGERLAAAPRFDDYRKMFDKLGNKIDAVTISIPDHCHFPAAMTALGLGKHIYVEKPLAHTVWETRELTRVAREKKVMTQMGNQGHTHDGTRLLKEWVQGGVLGEVREVVSWTNRPFFPPWREPIGSYHAARSFEVHSRRAADIELGRVARRFRGAAVRSGVYARLEMARLVGFRHRARLATWRVTSWTARTGHSIWACPRQLKQCPRAQPPSRHHMPPS